ncbi:hypothetical protein D9M70_504900 [compost metagenome]
MPNGELSRERNSTCRSATPSPSLSRSRVMRLALGTVAPARAMTFLVTQPLIPRLSSGLGGALDSATSTSPLGRVYSQRGWSRFSAKRCTARPGAARGAVSAGQPMAGAMCMVGNSVLTGSGRRGFGPMPSSTGSVARSPHPVSNNSRTATVGVRMAGPRLWGQCSLDARKLSTVQANSPDTRLTQ